jgi:hypothetical protein
MRIGLDYINQIRGNAQENVNASDTDISSRAGWIAQQFTKLVAQVAPAYHREHNDDDTHSTIHATGEIFERERTTAMGDWIVPPYLSTNFTASAGTWAVSGTALGAFQFMLSGSTMTVAWYIESSTLATAAAATLFLRIPSNAVATRQFFGTCAYDDNGTLGTGVVQVRPTSGGTRIELYKDVRGTATWSVSAALTVVGQVSFEVNGTV